MSNDIQTKVREVKTAQASGDASVAEITADDSVTQDICMPDICRDKAEVIYILLTVGDFFEAGQEMLRVEDGPNSMVIPAPFAGTVVEVKVAVGDKVSEGTALFVATSVEA